MSLHYTPAGAEAWLRSSQLHVTYEKNKIEQTQFGKKWRQWRLRDRTLSLTITTQKSGVIEIYKADQVASVADAIYAASSGISKVLANPIHKEFAKQDFSRLGIECIIDSGGFQMLKGTVDFVDPDDVIAQYNECADIGMPLDLPINVGDEAAFWDPISRLIRANDEYIEPRLNKGIDLALVSHGTTLEKRKRRLDVLDRDAKVIAIAGLGIKPAHGIDHMENSIENLMYVVTRYRKQARHFHVLGITSKFWMFVYALLSASGYVKSIGADSVSHRLAALVGDYETTNFETISLPKALQYRRYPSCVCPVCSLTSDLRIISNWVLLEAHNLWVRAAQARMSEEIAASYIAGHVKLDEIVGLLQLKQKPHKLHRVFNYVLEMVASGKFKPIKKDHHSGSLFGKSTPRVDPSSRTLQIIKSYEKFHKKKFI